MLLQGAKREKPRIPRGLTEHKKHYRTLQIPIALPLKLHLELQNMSTSRLPLIEHGRNKILPENKSMGGWYL